MTREGHDLFGRTLELSAAERGQVFDELFESLAGHDELNVLLDELERRGDLASEPDMAEIERRLRSVEEPGAVEWLTWEEVLANLSRRLEERRASADDDPPATPPEPRLPGKVGDLIRAAVALPPPERGALAHAILETIERCDEPPNEDER
jgi:hypothetical protein